MLYQNLKLCEDKKEDISVTLYGFLVKSLYHLIFDVKIIIGKYFYIKN